MKLIKSLLLLGLIVLFMSCDEDENSTQVYIYTGVEPIDEYAMTTDSQGNIVEFVWTPKFDRVYSMFEITSLSFEQPETEIAGIKKITFNGDNTVTTEGIDDLGEDFNYTISVSKFEEEGLGQLLTKDVNGDYLFPVCNWMRVYVQVNQSIYVDPYTCGYIDDLAAFAQAEYLDHHAQGDTLGISYVQLRYSLQD